MGGTRDSETERVGRRNGRRHKAGGRKQMMRQLRMFVLGTAILTLAPLCATAQVAAPGAGRPAAIPEAGAAPPAAPLAVKPDPAVDTIVDSNPQTPGELLRAAGILADLGRADLAKRYLQQ